MYTFEKKTILCFTQHGGGLRRRRRRRRRRCRCRRRWHGNPFQNKSLAL